MEKREQVDTAIGTALLFIAFTSIFSMLNKLVATLLIGGEIGFFIKLNILWLLVVAAIIVALIGYINKSNEKGYLDILQNENICIITGVLVALEGLVNLSSALPSYIMSIQMASTVADSSSGKVVAADVICIIIYLCQILFGSYLARRLINKKV